MVRRILAAVAATSLAAAAILTPPPALSVELEAPTYFVGHPGWEYAPGSQCADPDYWTVGDWTSGGAYNSDNDAIQDAADNAASGSIIHICAGTYGFAEEVTVAAGKSLTFQGDGEEETTLDGNDITRIFNANPSQSNDQGGVLGISNLLIMDAEVEAADNKNGAAVYADGLVLSSVTITRSWDAYNGGALYAEGDVSISRSTFTDNVARYDGGAIYSWNPDRSVTIADSKFTDNGAGYSSGAIISAGDLSITSSEFLDNHSSRRPGGVLAGNNLSVVDSLFERNSTEVESAGAIVATGIGASVSITGSEFIDNTAFGHGGALVMERLDELKIMDTLFEGNVSERRFGGAINIYDVDRVSVVSSTFVSNEARGGDFSDNGNGGAIDACNVASFTSINSRYIDNVSTENGGAIGLFGITCASPGTITMTRNLFSGNSARSAGGALWLSGTLASMIGNRFLGNESGSLGGAVYGGWSEGAELVTRVVQRNTFTGNRAAEGGGAIWLPGQIDALTRNEFVRNWSGGDGGAITVSGLQGRGWHAIKGNRITRNTAEGRGGAFSLQCSSFSRSAQRRLVAANSLNGNIAASDRRSSGIYLASLC